MADVLLNSVCKDFNEFVAVKDFNVSIADGELVTFLGPSGCGKTTTLRMIAGFLQPTSGNIKIGNRAVVDVEKGLFIPPEDRGVGMVFQSYAVWPHMTVFDNVAYPLKIKKTSKDEIKRRVGDSLELARMPELADRYPHQLSGGQQQRVALARALVMDPVILLLDEPLSNLDAKLREEMRFELKELQRKTSVTIIFVTHDQLEAMVLSDRVVVMNAGIIQQIGTPREIYSQPTNRFVADFIGVANFIECQVTPEDVVHLLNQPQYTLSVTLPDNLQGITSVTFMARPEEISIEHQKDSNTKIDKKIFIGDAVEYIVTIGDVPLRVRQAPTLIYRREHRSLSILKNTSFFLHD